MLTSQNISIRRPLHNEPFYRAGTNNQACLFLHGFGGGAHEMLWLAEHLNERGFTVQTLNYPGHDQPADAMPLCTWEQWYGHIAEAFRALKSRHDKVSVIGLSTGCPLALWLAHNEPVGKLILLSPFLKLKDHWILRTLRVPTEIFGPLMEKLRPVIQRKGPDIRDPEMARYVWQYAWLKSFNVSALRSALDLIRQVKAVAPTIQNPTLIIQSETDEVVDPSGARFLINHLGSADKEIHWLNRSNHVITMDYDRDDVFEKVLAFLSR
ncbi:MAG TPA: alpha/beta fold hydrolase [Coleofasciculaceae cyanobacterium]|jgi:carboxylesterase